MSARLRERVLRLTMRVRSRDEWEQVRDRGHGHWVLWQGVVGFGLPIILLTLLTLYFFGSSPIEIDRSWWVKLPAALVVGAGAGYIAADREWHRAEERFG